MFACLSLFFSCFFNDAAPPVIYTLSLHDALPISRFAVEIPYALSLLAFHDPHAVVQGLDAVPRAEWPNVPAVRSEETRLNSSHQIISYAVFCLKKKKYQNMAVSSLVLKLVVPDVV